MQDNHYEVAIIGLGIAGLVAAIEACKLNKTVVVFSDRPVPESYIRPQRLVLSNESVAYLRSLRDVSDYEDEQFFLKFFGDKMLTETKDLEKFLFRKLSHYSNLVINPNNEFCWLNAHIFQRNRLFFCRKSS